MWLTCGEAETASFEDVDDLDRGRNDLFWGCRRPRSRPNDLQHVDVLITAGGLCMQSDAEVGARPSSKSPGGFALKIETVADAARHVEEKNHFNRRFAWFTQGLHLLTCAIFFDREVLDFQTKNRLAVGIGH